MTHLCAGEGLVEHRQSSSDHQAQLLEKNKQTIKETHRINTTSMWKTVTLGRALLLIQSSHPTRSTSQLSGTCLSGSVTGSKENRWPRQEENFFRPPSQPPNSFNERQRRFWRSPAVAKSGRPSYRHTHDIIHTKKKTLWLDSADHFSYLCCCCWLQAHPGRVGGKKTKHSVTRRSFGKQTESASLKNKLRQS